MDSMTLCGIMSGPVGIRERKRRKRKEEEEKERKKGRQEEEKEEGHSDIDSFLLHRLGCYNYMSRYIEVSVASMFESRQLRHTAYSS